MYIIIFTLDYEIHGNGEGSPNDLMIEPTYRLLKLFDKYGAKLTIMADIAEILKFKEYAEEKGEDLFFYTRIVNQLREAIRNGHDVQLHIHPSYFKSQSKNGCWKQDYTEYNIALLSYDQTYKYVSTCKSFLEKLLIKEKSDYVCTAFRAANWAISPSKLIVESLINCGIKIDTSVFKYGTHKGIVNFNFNTAYSNLIPWPVDKEDICKVNKKSRLFEVPIYCEKRYLTSFINYNRFYRTGQSYLHRSKAGSIDITSQENKNNKTIKKVLNKIPKIFSAHPLKMDFNQCTDKQLVNMLENIKKNNKNIDINLPVVLIGHSKLYNQRNQKTLEKFLKTVSNNKSDYTFGTFSNIDFESIRKYHNSLS